MLRGGRRRRSGAPTGYSPDGAGRVPIAARAADAEVSQLHVDVEPAGDLLRAAEPRRRRRLALGGAAWGLAMTALIAASEDTPENLTYLVAVPASGLCALLLVLTRRSWAPLLRRRPLAGAVAAGVAGATTVEVVFWLAQAGFGAEDVAAHSNLALDLAITLPWYALLARAFALVQRRRRFGPATVLLLGAVYETGADAIVGGILHGAVLSPFFLPLLALVAFWQFILVYASIVLPPALVVAGTAAPAGDPAGEGPAWKDALRPLLWLVPYAAYVLALLAIVAVAG